MLTKQVQKITVIVPKCQRHGYSELFLRLTFLILKTLKKDEGT